MRIERPSVSITLAVLTGAGLAAGPAAADVIEFTFEGVVTAVDGTPNSIWADVAIDQPLTVRIVFDSLADDLSGSSQIGQYETLLYEVSIGAASTQIDAQITVQLFSLSHNYFAIGEYYEGDVLWRSTLGLIDNTSTAWTDDGIPTDLSLDDFDEREFALEEIHDLLAGDPTDPLNVTASIESLSVQVLPGPGPAVVLLGGLWAGLRRRRRA
jgi:hypothetical protein